MGAVGLHRGVSGHAVKAQLFCSIVHTLARTWDVRGLSKAFCSTSTLSLVSRTRMNSFRITTKLWRHPLIFSTKRCLAS